MIKQQARQRAIVDAISATRQEAGLSQRQLSEKLNQAVNFIQRIESGERDISVAEFIGIAIALKVDPCDMLRKALR